MYKEYFFLYLIYGFAFISMGTFCLKEKNKELIDLSLIKSLKYLGCFGIIHGITEWITMTIVAELYPDISLALYNINQILKSLSFTCLTLFGLDLLPIRKKYKGRILIIPVFLFFLYIVGYLWLMAIHGADFHLMNLKYSIITMRYSMAFPSGILSAVALFINANFIAKSKSIKMANRYKSLAWIFLINGLLEGLFVSQSNFFPANLINKDLFMEYLKVPSLALKVLVGLFISILLYKVIETFDWEQKEKINRLKNHRIASEVRRKLGLEIHDNIIQGLYAAGLKVEYVMLNKDKEKAKEILEEVKIDLNDTIEKTREFISHSSLQEIEIEDLISNLQQLIHQYNENQSIKISLKCETSSLHFGQFSAETSTQIYYVIQEAICNVVKHSKASHAEVWIETKQNYLYITIIDYGIGIPDLKNIDEQIHLGISSMKERSESVGGSFHISKRIKGTLVEVKIPWEGSKMKEKIKVLLVDDHTIVRKGLRLILELHDRIDVCGEAGSLKEMIDMIVQCEPDVILLDFKLPDGDGVEGCKKIRSRFPDIKILILTAYSQDHIVMEAIRAGANGYLLKNIKGDELIKSIFSVYENESVLDPSVADGIFKQLHIGDQQTDHQLSPRETNILNLISKGKTNKEIAEALYISEKTVRNYTSTLFKKINVHNRTEAARYWLMKNS